MPPSHNFTRVALGADPATGGQALFVDGVSPPGEANEIFVALPHGGELPSALVDNPQSSRWRATVPEGKSPFQAGSEILVVGVALGGPAPDYPFLWQNSLKIEPGA